MGCATPSMRSTLRAPIVTGSTPSTKDGRRGCGAGSAGEVELGAAPRLTGPYVAYAVTCGITFTYGGLKIDTSARVIDTVGKPMEGLYATGEIAGGFFFHNYAAGSGLMRGATFGRIAGREAARDSVGDRAGG